jgi:dihydrofolate reductase
MGRIFAVEYVSLDGVVEDPGPTGDFAHRGWTMPYWSDELGELQSELLFASDALLLGRTTYEEFAAAWPERSGDPFTDRINGMPKYVASATLAEPLAWNATLLEGDVAEAVASLKREQSLLLYGSATLVDTLTRHGLIDVYRLILYPLLLGSGQRLFAEPGTTAVLALDDVRQTDSGVVVLTYSSPPS